MISSIARKLKRARSISPFFTKDRKGRKGPFVFALLSFESKFLLCVHSVLLWKTKAYWLRGHFLCPIGSATVFWSFD